MKHVTWPDPMPRKHREPIPSRGRQLAKTCTPALRALPLILAISVFGCERRSIDSIATPPPARQITTFAAASTHDIMREAAHRFETRTGTRIIFSFDASSNLARQIKAGAKADLFLSADERWMDDVDSADMIQRATRNDLLGNQLVIIAPAKKLFNVTMSKEWDFVASLPWIRRIAIGDPSHVPAGRYARQALQALDWWPKIEPLMIPTQDVRAALRLVEMGEADAGIVYLTDARRSQRVVTVGVFPSNTHEPIRYPIALCKGAAVEAEDFLRFLRYAEATEMLERAGFEVLSQDRDERTHP